MFWTTTGFLIAYFIMLLAITFLSLILFGACYSILNLLYSISKTLREINHNLSIKQTKTNNEIIGNDFYK